MNGELIKRWNQLVKPEDTVYYLGDFSLSPSALWIVRQLNGTKSLVPGNHDRVHPAHHKNKEVKMKNAIEAYLNAGFSSITLEDSIQIGDKTVLMHHMPYVEDQTYKPRYEKYRPVDTGLWLLHGHIHELWKVKNKMINVGVDVWDYKPVSIAQIEEIIKSSELSK